MEPPSARDLFDQATLLPAEQREAFIRNACDDPEVIEQVLSLLAHHTESEGPFEEGAVNRYRTLARSLGDEIAEFRIIRELGRGGMGIVYLVEDTVLKRQVALKILSSHLVGSERALLRFRHEAKVVAGLNHPAIVQIHKYDFVDDVHFMVMAYVQGETLSHRLGSLGGQEDSNDERSPPRDREELVELATTIGTIADALDHAHQHNVIHRDVKPSNILVDHEGQAYLTDFGIARLLAEEPLTFTGDVAGTTHYMSPEQAGAESMAIDHRTDVFSLGVVLYEALTRHRPFEAESNEGVLRAIREREPPRVRELNPAIPKDLATICHKSLEKRPADRYQTAAHLAADLRCWERGDPILAKPQSAMRVLRRQAKASKGRIAVASLILLVLISGVLAMGLRSSWLADRGRLVVRGDVPGGRVAIQLLASDWHTIERSREFSRVPAKAWLRPGLYRVVFSAGDAFSESHVLIHEGDRQEITMTTPPTDDETSWIRYPTAAYEVGDQDSETTDPYDLHRRRTVRLAGFEIMEMEVSNADYQEYLDQNPDVPLPPHWEDISTGGPRPRVTDDMAKRPLVGVSWEQVQAYARWRGYRLPTAYEWEVAARRPNGIVDPNDPDGWLYSWGDDPDAAPAVDNRDDAMVAGQSSDQEELRRWYEQFSTDVDVDVLAIPGNRLLNAFGNVQEYTASINPTRNDGVIIRGGTWSSSMLHRNLVRYATLSGTHLYSFDRGVRLARSVEAPAKRSE